MSVSTRLRFEIFKRDGFRCKYCGCSPLESVLHVDHVIPRAGGGTDDPANLITSCASCNLGKSDIGLDESRIAPQKSPSDLIEQAQQISAYLEAARSLAKAMDGFRQQLANMWLDATGDTDMPEAFVTRLCNVVERHGLEICINAIEATRRKGKRGTDAHMYFNGTVRKMVAA